MNKSELAKDSIKCSVLVPCLKETELMKKNRSLLENSEKIDEFIYEIGTKPVGKARQNLLKKAKNEYVLWLDDDVEIFENPVNKLIAYLENNGNVAGICCFAFEEDKKYNYFEIERQLLPDIYPKRQAHFMCGLYRKSMLEEAGGFDAGLDIAEDHDMQIKLNQKGYEIMCFRDVIVKHHIVRDFQKEKKYFEGRKYLYNKYGTFEVEHDNIDLYSLKAKLKIFKISKKLFLKKTLNYINNKLYFFIRVLYEIPVNLVREYIPEIFRPQVCGILITENCIFKCSSCTYWKSHKQDLPIEKVLEIVDKLAKFKIPKIFLVGGEPLIRDDFGKIIDYIKKNKIKVGVVTNGYLGEKRLDDLLKLDEIIVSVDGMKDTHNRLRGIDSWDKAIDLIYLLKHKYRKDVKLAFVFQKENYKDFEVLASFMKKMEVPVDILCYSTKGMGQPEENSKTEYDKELDDVICNIDRILLYEEQLIYMELIKNKIMDTVSRQKCIVPNFKIMIDSQGGIYPCSAWGKPIANIFESENFAGIWESYADLRKKIRNGDCEWCARCRSCEITINYVLGLNYIKMVFSRIIGKLQFGIKKKWRKQ